VEWHQLEALRVVARLQNVSRAAEELHVAQPALSRSIARLERELGVSLFDRSARAVSLTPAGAAFVPYVERALAELDEGRRVLHDVGDLGERTIALGFLHTLGAEYVPRLVAAFKGRHGDVRFDFNQNATNALERALLAGALDLCLTAGPFAQGRITWSPLVEEEVILIVPRGHRFAGRESLRLAEAAHESFVSFKHGLAMRDLSDELCVRAGFQPTITFEGEESMTVSGFVAAGLGIAIVPGVTPSSHGVVRLHISEPAARRTIGIAWRADRYLSRAARAFRDFVLQDASSAVVIERTS
jgi:DNA-binding transcriptional LysR family regulator